MSGGVILIKSNVADYFNIVTVIRRKTVPEDGFLF